MEILVYIGAGIALAGLAGRIWCIIRAVRIRRAGGDDAAIKAKFKSLVAINMGALFLSVIGLMMVVIGIFLSS